MLSGLADSVAWHTPQGCHVLPPSLSPTASVQKTAPKRARYNTTAVAAAGFLVSDKLRVIDWAAGGRATVPSRVHAAPAAILRNLIDRCMLSWRPQVPQKTNSTAVASWIVYVQLEATVYRAL
ncbi:hypothetical protein MTO96_013156 [Rhipicephalus appendiculatus]